MTLKELREALDNLHVSEDAQVFIVSDDFDVYEMELPDDNSYVDEPSFEAVMFRMPVKPMQKPEGMDLALFGGTDLGVPIDIPFKNA